MNKPDEPDLKGLPPVKTVRQLSAYKRQLAAYWRARAKEATTYAEAAERDAVIYDAAIKTMEADSHDERT